MCPGEVPDFTLEARLLGQKLSIGLADMASLQTFSLVDSLTPGLITQGLILKTLVLGHLLPGTLVQCSLDQACAQ